MSKPTDPPNLLDPITLPIYATPDALVERLIAAEKLLHDADAVIEILLGDFHHKHAEEVVAAIATHWNTYPEPLE